MYFLFEKKGAWPINGALTTVKYHSPNDCVNLGTMPKGDD
jgi:hypothetical protein